MSTPTEPAGTPAAPAPPPRPRRQRNVLRDLALLLIPVVLVLGGVGAYLYWGVYKAVGTVSIPEQIRNGLTVADRLDDDYVADGDKLVAAPPADASKHLDPAILKVGVLEPSDKLEVWAEFAKRLEEKTGKKVEVVHVPIAAAEAVRE